MTAWCGPATGSSRGRNTSIRATVCRSSKTRWTRSHTSFLHTIVSGAVFTDEFGVLPELDFVETPVGIIYVATRRVGDNVWSRIGRERAAQPAAGRADLGNRPQEHPVQRPDDEPLARADRRHQHDVHRAAPCQRDRRQITPDWWADRCADAAGPDAARHLRGSPAPPAAISRRRCRSGRSPFHGMEHLERDRPRHHHVPQPDPARHPGGEGRQ